jgi:hexosaminidase
MSGAAVSRDAVTDPLVALVPRPAELALHPGRFVIPATLNLCAGPGAGRAADLLAHYLGDDRARTNAPDTPGIRLDLVETADRRLGNDRGPADRESYALQIRTERVTLSAPQEAGLFHGVQTLRQLLPAGAADPAAASGTVWSWPCLTIRDAPRLPWRGVLLDVARHFMPPQFLYRFVDLLALHKLNVLHLHLTDDQGWRIEIDGLPLLTEIGAWRAQSMIGPAGSDRFDGVPHGGYYTRRELTSLVQYAAARGIRIVPEIDLPGHARAALAAYPRVGNEPDRRLSVWTSWGVSEDIFGVHDEALDFCREVLGQTLGLFPGRYIHIGGDECPTRQWETSAAARARVRELGLGSPAELHGWFLSQMRDFLAEHGRRAVCWDETGHAADARLPADVALTAWREVEHGRRAVRRGHQVIMAPHLSTYFDYPQRDHPDEPPGHPQGITTLRDVYRFEPLAGALHVADPDDGLRPGVLGTQAQLWTEFAPTPAHVEYLAFPRLCALAEVAWSGTRDYADFTARLARHAGLLRALGVPVGARIAETMDA